MTVYKDINHQVYEADSAEELVRHLHESSYAQAADDFKFMKEMAGRVEFTTNQLIRCSSPREFVDDLIKIGFLNVDQEKKDEEDKDEKEEDSRLND
jgi:hypothetical protein